MPAPVTCSSLLQEVTEAVNQGAYAGKWPDPAFVEERRRLLAGSGRKPVS